MKTLNYRYYKNVEIVQRRTPKGFDSIYYNSTYLFKLGGRTVLKHRLCDAKAKINKYMGKE
tara:strand:+ start:4755 stop:4937 length:183 start_codon:yes stop_codon:yes gene_type:complete